MPSGRLAPGSARGGGAQSGRQSCSLCDPAAFAAALVDVAGDAARATGWGGAGRRRLLAHFTIDEMVRRYEQVYHHAAAR